MFSVEKKYSPHFELINAIMLVSSEYLLERERERERSRRIYLYLCTCKNNFQIDFFIRGITFCYSSGQKSCAFSFRDYFFKHKIPSLFYISSINSKKECFKI
jgi:hypothetical protein